MKIVVVNTAASSGGALSILKDFYQYIKENDVSNEWIFFLSDYYIEETENITVKVIKESKNKINRLKMDNLNGHRLISQYNPDVVFSMQNTTVSNLSVPQVVYLHQSIPFQNIKNYSFFKKEEYNFAIIQHILGANIKYGLRRADKTIVQTNWMKEAIIEQTSLKTEDILVISPSINIEKNIINRTKTFQPNRFFYPTSSIPYKNNSLIDEACDYIDSIEPSLNYRVDITVEEDFGNNHIHSIGNVSRNDVFNKLNNEVLVFPSYIETFGLPLAEGRQLNSIIFAADTPFAREVLSGYENAYYFNPFKAEELAELMLKVINGEIAKKSIAYANEYADTDSSWDTVLAAIIKIGNKNIERVKNDETF